MTMKNALKTFESIVALKFWFNVHLCCLLKMDLVRKDDDKMEQGMHDAVIISKCSLD